MSGWVKDVIRKGKILRKLDQLSTSSEAGEAFLKALKDKEGKTYRDYTEVLLQHGLVNAAEAAHLRRHWFPDTATLAQKDALLAKEGKVPWWWDAYQPIEPLLRQGMIEAFEKAKTSRWLVPVDAYWMAVGDRVLVSVSWNERQITMVRVTPPVPKDDAVPADAPGYTKEEPILVIRHKEDTAPGLVEVVPVVVPSY
jgi:hypothetical protein